MEFLNTIGLNPKHIDPDKYRLTKVFVRDCQSEYTPSSGTVGILVSFLKNEDVEEEKAPSTKAKGGQLTWAEPVPAGGIPQSKVKKIKPNSPNDFVLFPFANIRYGGELCLRKIRKLGDIHKSELLMVDDPFILHETVNVVSVPNIAPVEFDLAMPDVYKYGAVSIQTTSPDNVMRALTGTLRNAATFFKYNCLLKFHANSDYLNSKYGPATLSVSIIQPSQFLPVFGKEDGCIIHLTVTNKRGHAFDVVCLAANKEEPMFTIDGDVLYERPYKNAFTSTTIPHVKKYAKYVMAALTGGNNGKVAKASKR